jgi:signal transduction histidine kinase
MSKVFRVYAWLALAGGFVVAAWGPVWLGADWPGMAYYKASFIRVAGAALMAAGCFASAMDRVDEEAARARGCLYFALGHGIVLTMVVLQQQAIWASRVAAWTIEALALVTFGFFYFWIEARIEGGLSPRAWERRIREAAGQEERHRLARDLHDSVKQQIFAIQTAAATAQARSAQDPAGASAAIDQVRSCAREAMAEMEAMLAQLRAAPFDNAGLVSALQQQSEALGFRTGARVHFQLGHLPADLRVAPGAREALFRAAQEALSNVARHARAGDVEVSLGVVQSRLKLAVRDNGSGFDPGRPVSGMGLANMRARAEESGGLFLVESRPGAGTEVAIAIPCTIGPRIRPEARRALAWGGVLLLHLAWGNRYALYVPVTVLLLVRFGFALRAWKAPR